MEDIGDEAANEDCDKNTIKETCTFINKLCTDKGNPKPDNIYTFLGVKYRTIRPRSVTVIPSRSKPDVSQKEKVQVVAKEEVKIADSGNFDNISRKRISLLKRKLTIKESKKYDSGKLISLLQPEEAKS